MREWIKILYDKCNFVYDNNPIYGSNVIVISESEWVNKNGWGGSRGEDGVIIGK